MTITPDQIKLTEQLTAAVQKMALAAERAENSFQRQSEVITQLADAVKMIKMGDLNDNIIQINKSLRGLIGSLKSVGDANKQSFQDMAKDSEAVEKQVKTLTGRMREVKQVTQSLKSTSLSSLSDDFEKANENALNLSRSSSSVSSAATQIASSLGGVKNAADGINETVFDSFLRMIEEPGHATKLLEDQMQKLANTASKDYPHAFPIAAGAVMGFWQGLKNVVSIGGAALGFMTGLADAAFNVGAAIVSIPFKMFAGLLDMANKAGGSNELAQAIENLRKQFGALYAPTNMVLKDMAINLKGFAATGLNSFRIFGDLAKRLNDFRELATAMGPTFQALISQFRDHGGAILAYQKGLGLSNEQMKAMGDRAITMGESMDSMFRDMTKQSYGFAKQFGMDAKLISRDMAKAAADVRHFGQVSVKELGVAVVYARKLGVEIEKLTGAMDAFETFDSAAENVAKLSQSFGVQLDAFELMEAQNPAEVIEKMRNAMRDAGQDASTFSRQQLKLLSSTVGLDEATAKQVFSMKNAGMSLNEINAQASKNEKKTMTQAQAMKQLADAIERLVQQGSGGPASFFERFFRGFLGGIQATREFSSLIMNIKMGLWAAEMAGVKAGKAFAAVFPGVKDFLGAFRDLMDAKKVGNFFNKFSDNLKQFFTDVSTGKYSFGELMERVKKDFFEFFNEKSGKASKLLESGKKFLFAFGNVLLEGVKWAAVQVSDGIAKIGEFITNPEKFIGANAASNVRKFMTSIADQLVAGASWVIDKIADLLQGITNWIANPNMYSTAGKMGKVGESLFSPLFDAITKILSKAWDTIGPAVTNLMTTLATKIGNYLSSSEFRNLMAPYAPYLALVFFGPAFTKSLFSALSSGMSAAAGQLIASRQLKKSLESVTTNMTSTISQMTANTAAKAPDVGAMLPSSDSAKKATESLKTMSDGASKFDKGKVLTFLVGLAGVVAIGLAGFYVALKIVEGKKKEDIAAALAVVGGSLLAMLPALPALYIMQNSPKINGAQLAEKLLALAGVVTIGMVPMLVALDVVKGYTMTQVLAALAVVGGAATAMLTASVPLALLSFVKIDPTNAAIGIASVAVTVAAMVGAIGLITKGVNAVGADIGKMNSMSAAIIEMSKVFLLSGVVVVEAMGIGALITSTGGLAAGAALAGFAVMAVAVKSMSEVVVEIMSSVDKVNVGRDFGSKMESFTRVFSALTDFTKNFSDIMKASQPSFMSVLRSGETTADNVQSLAAFVRTLIGGPGTGMFGLIESIVDSATKLSGGDSKALEGAKIFADLLVSAASLAKALQPPEKFFEATKGFFTSAKDVNSGIDKLSINAAIMGDQISKLVSVFKEHIFPLVQGNEGAGLSENAVKNAAVVGTMLSSIMNVAQAITPSSTTLQALRDVDKGVFGETSGMSPQALDKLGDYMKTTSRSLQEFIPSMINSLNPLFTILSNFTLSDSSAGAIKAISGIIEAAVATARTVFGAAAQLGGAGVNTDAAQIVNKISATLPTVFASISTSLPSMITGIKDAVENIKASAGDTKSFSTSAQMLKEIINVVKEVVSVPKELSGLNITGIKGEMINSLNSFATDLGLLMKGEEAPLVKLNNSLDAVVAGSIAQKADFPKKLESSFSTIDQVAGMVKSFAEGAASNYGEIKTGALATSITALTNIVQETQKLDDALSKLGKLDVKAKLQQVAKSAGLGGKAVYTVQSKEVVINVNFTVTMDVGEAEKIMVTRQKSIIRDRINYLGTKTDAGKENNYKIKPNSTPALMMDDS